MSEEQAEQSGSQGSNCRTQAEDTSGNTRKLRAKPCLVLYQMLCRRVRVLGKGEAFINCARQRLNAEWAQRKG